MNGSFWELPPFHRIRSEYLDDAGSRRLQDKLMDNPEIGDVFKGTSGIRKLQCAGKKRSKGKRGGLRIICNWRLSENQFWFLSLIKMKLVI